MTLSGDEKAARQYRHLQLLAALMAAVNNRVERAMSTEEVTRQRALIEAFYRATCWMLTLAKLNDSYDIQARCAGGRALLEIAIDMAWLHKSTGDDDAKKLYAFEASQKLKSTNVYRAFISRFGQHVQPDFQPMLDWGATNEAAIKAARTALWKGKHPDRWTGGSGVPDDALAIDRTRSCKCWSPGAKVSMDRVCTESYSYFNWLTHGSGGAGLRGVTDQGEVDSTTLFMCVRNGLIAVEIMRHEAGALFNVPAVQTAWEALKQAIIDDGGLWEEEPL